MTQSGNKTFYISTPIYYPNAKLHIGHAYTTLMADCFVRYKQLRGYQTFFVTGVDEHGQKIMTEAAKHHLSPQAWVDYQTKQIKALWALLNVKYDRFVRTTNPTHQQHVQTIFHQLQQQQDIYLSNYEGYYCNQCEEFITDHLMNQAQTCFRCHQSLTLIQEASYFLKVSHYQQWIEQQLTTNPTWCQPSKMVHEMRNNFCTPHLQDLSITRTKLPWGIPVKDDPSHVIYVWFDALINYLSCLNYCQRPNPQWEQFWNPDTEIVQLFGKEIARFHVLYWPILLKMLNLRQPSRLLAHGWILLDGVKMSKSKNNVIDPEQLVAQHGTDAVRFYLTSQLNFFEDNKYHYDLFVEAYNRFLANTYGNLIARVNNMYVNWINRPWSELNVKLDRKIMGIITTTYNDYAQAFDAYDSKSAFNAIERLLTNINKFLETTTPWHCQDHPEQLWHILSNAILGIIVSTYLLKPFLPATTTKVLASYHLQPDCCTWDNLLDFKWTNKVQVTKIPPLFLRLKK